MNQINKSATKQMKIKLHVWRQKGPKAAGDFETYDAITMVDE